MSAEDSPDSIAVIGMACRFPGAPDVDSLWNLICSGRDVMRPAPDGRYIELAGKGFRDSPLGRELQALRGGFLDGIDLFDAAAFNISPREARVVDPQQRLLLETAWEALEDAGQDIYRLAGGAVGVFVGVWNSDYQARLFRAFPDIDIAMTTGGGRYSASGRVSYAFDFRGPSLTVDTACSSSLVAIHLACQALRSGECALAIAGGANVILDSPATLGFLNGGALSRIGRCGFGDAAADGFARAEGAGAVVLKTLRAALADKDPIQAIIRGSAVTHSGQTGGSLIAPGEEAQIDLLNQALADAGIPAGEIDYIEAHGTGTRVGDRTELRALGKAISAGRPSTLPPCLVGSIKTNIGHTESAAGVAGLIKAILCLRHREVPANLHFKEPNPEVPWGEIPLRIVTERTPLRGRDGPAFAGVNSFGITGTFAHVVLEEGPATVGAPVPEAGGPGEPLLLPVSARSRGALAHLAGAYAAQIRASPALLPSVARSAALGRSHHELRVAVAGREAGSMAAALEAFARGETAPCLSVPPVQSTGAPRVGWIFSGQGPQWPGMGRQLLEAEPVFRATIERLEDLIGAQTGWSLLAELGALDGSSKLHLTAIAQPAIFALQIALAELLKSWGLRPAMILGHSVGEAAAACVAGVLSLEEAAQLICERGRLAERAAGLGRMAAVELSVDEARDLIDEMGGVLSLAAVNAPRSLTISGPAGPLGEFCKQVAARGRFCRLLDVDYPFHSALLDPLLAEMSAIGEAVSPRTPHTPLYSSVHGRLAVAADFTPAYWARNLRDTVQFGPAAGQMAAAGCNLFVEISPHPVLSFSIKQVAQSMNVEAHVVETLHRSADEAADLRRAVGDLYVLGCDPDWRALAPANGGRTPLPAYRWQRESYWLDEKPRPSSEGFSLDPLLQRSFRPMDKEGAFYWESELSLERFPWLAEHCVQGRPVFPATGYLIPALKAAGQLMPGAVLAGIEFQEALFIPEEEGLAMQFRFQRVETGLYELTIHAGGADHPELARRHFTARVQPAAGAATPVFPDAAAFEDASPPAGREEVYAALRRGRLEYGPAFQGIEILRRGRGQALARVTLPAAILDEARRSGIHPATLDACIQALVTLAPGWPGDPWVPRALRELSLHKLPDPEGALLAWAVAEPSADPAAAEITGDVFVRDEAGELVAAARGLRLQRVSRDHAPAEWMHEVRWKPEPLPPAAESMDASFAPGWAELESAMMPEGPSAGEGQSIRAEMADLDRLAALNIEQALNGLGLDLAPGRRLTFEEVVAEAGIAASHRRLLGRLLQILADEGLLSANAGGWRVERPASRVDASAELLAARIRHPDLAPLWDLFDRASANLASVLSGRRNAVEVLFGGDGAAALEWLYSSHPFWLASMRQSARAVSEIAGRLPGNRKLRILEIGGGTGGLASHLLPVLPADRCEYLFTDLSSSFLAKTLEKFAAYPFLKDKTLDVERDPLAQGFPACGFDLIVAANCLHATRDLRQSLDHAARLLAPGGWLLLQEDTAPARWTDMIFGLTDGWWRFEDTELRPAHPLLGPEAWVKLLREQGFSEAGVIGGGAGDPCGSAVVLARKPAVRARGRWLLLPDAGETAGQLREKLEELGQPCLVAGAGSKTEEPSAAIAAWLASEDAADRTLVDLRALDAALKETEVTGELLGVEERMISGLVDVVRRLADSDSIYPPRLAVVTRGSQATGQEQGGLNLAQAPLWGVARVAAVEHPRLPVMRIDLDQGPLASQAAALAEELLLGRGEPEVAFRHRARLVPRLHRLEPSAADRLTLPGDRPFAIASSPRGSLDGLEAAPAVPREPGPGEVQIQVAAAGVNFRDLLGIWSAVKALPLGLECAGTVTAVGPEVRDFSVGDEVMAVTAGTWRTYVNIPAALVARKPPQLSMEQAAALPIAYLTVIYALREVAALRRGQRVLIHSAAGGVGLAAVHLSLAAGAEVFGTAGSPAKRDFLRSLGVRHVFDSRTLDFAEQISSMGEGMDVVLNCFTGEYIPKSLGLLAQGGHFVEIGKRGIWTASQMSELRPDVHYQVLDLAATMSADPEILRPMLRQLAAEVAEGALPPLPIRAFPMSHAPAALSHMQQARHTGKLVLRAPTPMPAMGSWLITGAFGGLGVAVAEWLVERGARNLILTGWRPPREAALAAIDRCAARGCRVVVEVLDVADESALASVLAQAAAELPPLRGVLHLAGLLDDAPIWNLSWQSFKNVYGPKVLGAWNLHRLTRGLPIEHFMLFSSWTAIIGAPGQAAHGSANAFLDALAHHRRAGGLTAQTINWGGWRETGSAARPERLTHLDRLGVGGMSTREALDALAQVMKSDAIQIGVSPFDPAAWRESNASESAGRFVEALIEEEAAPIGDASSHAKKSDDNAALPLREALRQAPPGAPRRQVIESCIQRRLARVLRMPSANFDVRKPFKHLGLDSLGSLEIRNLLEIDAGLKLPASLIYNHATIKTLATEMAALLGVSLEESPAPGAAAPAGDDGLDALLDELRELPAEEALRLLAADSPGDAR